MSETVTWADLDKFCAEKQHGCQQLQEQKAKTKALEIEQERRSGYAELQTALDKLTAKLETLEEMIASRSVWLLPKPILYLLCLGMIGVGVAGEKLINVVMKHVGGP